MDLDISIFMYAFLTLCAPNMSYISKQESLYLYSAYITMKFKFFFLEKKAVAQNISNTRPYGHWEMNSGYSNEGKDAKI